MKGIIFLSFVEFAEERFGLEFVDQMLSAVPTETDGAFSNVGTYPAEDLFAMAGYVSDQQGIDMASLQRAFGEYTFQVLAGRYAKLVDGFEDGFDCLLNLDQTIHRNVQKLYPDAELPSMDASCNPQRSELVLKYRSNRPLMHLAHGLLEGCLSHYGEQATVEMTDESDGKGTHATFVLARQ